MGHACRVHPCLALHAMHETVVPLNGLATPGDSDMPIFDAETLQNAQKSNLDLLQQMTAKLFEGTEH